MMSAIFSFSQLFTILPVWKRINQLRIQLSFIEISSHPSNKLLQHLQEAKALQHVIPHAGNLTCPLYQCFQQAGSARPAFTVHSREVNEAPCFDMPSHDLPGGSQTLALHSVGEASRFQIADVDKESHSSLGSQRISTVPFTGDKEDPFASPLTRTHKAAKSCQARELFTLLRLTRKARMGQQVTFFTVVVCEAPHTRESYRCRTPKHG